MRNAGLAVIFPLLGTVIGCRLLLVPDLAEMRLAKRAVRALPPTVEKYLLSSKLEVDLEFAGSHLDAHGFRARQLFSVVLGAIAAVVALSGTWVFTGNSGGGSHSLLGVRQAIVITVFASILPALGLELVVKRRAEKARDQAGAEVATLADLLCIAISSGESVRSGLAAISNLLREPLRSEVKAALAAVASGTSFDVAMATLADRIQRPSTTVMAEALCRAHERGISLSEQLRALAKDIREARRAAVVESMGKRQMLMIVPVVFLILPTALVFAALPGFYSLKLVMN